MIQGVVKGSSTLDDNRKRDLDYGGREYDRVFQEEKLI